MLQEFDRTFVETLNPIYIPMASTPLDTIPEEPTAAPTPPPAPTPAAAPARVTADPPQTKPATAKNPGRVVSGKRLAERNRLAREAKKKAQAEAANTSASTSAGASISASDSGGGPSLLTLLGIGGLIVSAAGVYYQREAIQARFRAAPSVAAPPTPAPAPAPSRIPVKKGGIKKME